jgi:hypothetical protein
MRVNKFLLPLFGVVPMVTIVLIAQLTGTWSTSGRATVDMASMKPEDIKGWMTWQEVSDGFGIPLDELYALTGVPNDIPPTTAMKDMEGLLDGFETTAVREVVAAYLAGDVKPAEPAMDEVTPRVDSTPEAAQVVEPVPTATPTQPSAVDVAPVQPAATQEHVPAGDGSGDSTGDGTGPTPLPPGQILPAAEIKGRHTLVEIAQQSAVPLDELIVALNLPVGVDPNTQVKDLVSSGAVAEVQTVRDAVTELQASQ